MRPAHWGLAAIAVAVLLAVPLAGNPFYVTQLSRILVFAIFAMSLDLLVGYCGLVSLGHAAFFGIGAYAGALLAEPLGIANPLLALPASLAASAAAALLIGVLSLRASGVYFIMVTLAFAQMIYFVFSESDALGGSNGILVLTDLKARVGGWELLDLGAPVPRYYATLAIAAAVLVGLRHLVGSPFGRAIQGIRENERRMRALGYPVQRYKLACFVIAGTLGGLAGYLYFALTSFADPTLIDWLQSAQLLVIVILGGMGTLVGPALGAAAFILFVDQASELTEHWKIALGVIVILVTLFGRGGLVALIQRLVPALAPRPGGGA